MSRLTKQEQKEFKEFLKNYDFKNSKFYKLTQEISYKFEEIKEKEGE